MYKLVKKGEEYRQISKIREEHGRISEIGKEDGTINLNRG